MLCNYTSIVIKIKTGKIAFTLLFSNNFDDVFLIEKKMCILIKLTSMKSF